MARPWRFSSSFVAANRLRIRTDEIGAIRDNHCSEEAGNDSVYYVFQNPIQRRPPAAELQRVFCDLVDAAPDGGPPGQAAVRRGLHDGPGAAGEIGRAHV